MTRPSLPQSPLLRVSILPDRQRIDPGAQGVFRVSVENRSSTAQAVNLEVRGLPSGWFRLAVEGSLRMFPDDSVTASLIVSVPAGETTRQQEFEVFAIAGSAESAAAGSFEIVAEEAAPEAPALRPPDVSITPSEIVWRGQGQQAARLTVRVFNPDSRDVEYPLSLQGLPEAWYTLPPRIRVPALQSWEVELRLHPPERAPQSVSNASVIAAVPGYASLRGEGHFSVSVAPRDADTPGGMTPVPSQPSAPPTRPPQPSQPPEVSFQPARYEFRFLPGQIAEQVTVVIRNRSTLIEHYTIAVESQEPDWYSLVPAELRVDPNGAAQVQLRITPSQEAIDGAYPFSVRVIPRGYPEAYGDRGGRVLLSRPASFDARLVPDQATGRREKFKLTLMNTGGQPLNLLVSASDPEGMCNFKFNPPPNLKPGEELVVPVWVGARRSGLVGDPKAIDFSLRVTPAGSSVSASKVFGGRLVHQPFIWPRMLSYGGLAFFLGTFMLLLMALTGGHPERAWSAAMNLNECRGDRELDGAYAKPECGGATIGCQDSRSSCANFTPLPPTAQATATPAATAGPTDPSCLSNPEYRLSKGSTVVLHYQAIIRDAPAGNDTTLRERSLSGQIQLVDGPRCVNDLKWWQISFQSPTATTGWVAEFGGGVGSGEAQLICLAPEGVRPQGRCPRSAAEEVR